VGEGLTPAQGARMTATSRRRWLMCSMVIGTLLCVLGCVTFLTLWFVTWPWSPISVVRISPWMEPRLRAYGALLYQYRFRDQGEAGVPCEEAFSLIANDPTLILRPEFGDCLKSDDPLVKGSALWLVEFLPLVSSQNIETEANSGIGPQELQVRFDVIREAIEVDVVKATLDADPFVSAMAHGSLRFISSEAAKPALRRALSSRPHRERAIRDLAIPGDHEAALWLIPLLKDGDPEIRALSVRSLTSIGDAKAIPAVRELQADPYLVGEVEDFFKRFPSDGSGVRGND
jgi:hypothetical protein